jgi:lipopolysaccharide export system protein LptA
VKVWLANLFLLLSVVAAFAQNDARGKLRLVHADSAISFEENGRIIRELIGNVEFAQDSATMTCERAREIPAEKKTIFTGKVHMREGKRWLRADEVLHFEGRNEQRALGNVSLGDGPNLLRAKFVTYFQKERMAIADSSVILTNRERRLRLTCGHLVYLRAKEYTDATIKPVLVEFDSLYNEALRITGERIELFDGGKRAKVSRQVKITRSNTRAECGEAEYFRDAERLELRVDPVAWQEGDKLKGRRIDLFLTDQKLNRAHVVENAEMTSEIDTVKVGKRLNTLSGKEITMLLKDEKVERAIVEGTATSEYYVIEEGKEKGKVRVQGDKITLFVENQTLKRVIIESDPGSSTGRFWPAGVAEGNKSP